MKTLKDFSRDEINKIAEEYATLSVSRSYFIEKYKISSSTFYNILKKAIIEHIVPISTVFKMRDNAIKNSNNKLSNDLSTNRIMIHYDYLLQRRKTFIFSKKKRISLLKEFANRDLSISKLEFCKSHFIDIELLDKMFIQSSIYSEIPKNVYEKIKSRSLSLLFSYSSTIFFMELENFIKKANSGETINVEEVYSILINYIKSNAVS